MVCFVFCEYYTKQDFSATIQATERMNEHYYELTPISVTDRMFSTLKKYKYTRVLTGYIPKYKQTLTITL